MSVRVSCTDGIARVSLDAPPLNILTRALMEALRGALIELAGRADLRVVILYGEGPHFSAGASVEEHLPGEVAVMIPEFIATIGALHHFPLPVIAAVRGRCLGGAFELVLAADILVATDDAILGVPEVRLGVFPPAACVQLSTRNPGLAAELLFTGDAQPAPVLADLGLVHKVVPADRLDDEIMGLAGRVARHSAATLRATKRALRAAVPDPTPALERVARIYLDELMPTADAVEGLTAFVEKRKPEWRHR